ncbi:MAG TPA: hypothetical protein VHC90_15405 [Bryobacteraceae bacterium]|nr:hypothetical protein [Bryobacteraceae bacterium]
MVFLRIKIIPALFVLLFPAFVRAADEVPPVLTVCEALSDMQKYEGKSVIIVGRSVSTDEGWWLDEECGLRVVNGGHVFGPSISVGYVGSQFSPPPATPARFRWDMRLLEQKLAQVRRSTKLPNREHDRWLAVFGRLEMHLPRELRPGVYDEWVRTFIGRTGAVDRTAERIPAAPLRRTSRFRT